MRLTHLKKLTFLHCKISKVPSWCSMFPFILHHVHSASLLSGLSDQTEGEWQRSEVLPESREAPGRAELGGETVRPCQGRPGRECVRLGGQGRVGVSPGFLYPKRRRVCFISSVWLWGRLKCFVVLSDGEILSVLHFFVSPYKLAALW